MLLKADGEGYGGLPVVQLYTTERTAEFYAAGRLAYDGRGEPLKLEGSKQVAEFARRGGGRALVVVPVRDAAQLSAEPEIESRYIGDNGSVALVLVQTGSSGTLKP